MFKKSTEILNWILLKINSSFFKLPTYVCHIDCTNITPVKEIFCCSFCTVMTDTEYVSIWIKINFVSSMRIWQTFIHSLHCLIIHFFALHLWNMPFTAKSVYFYLVFHLYFKALLQHCIQNIFIRNSSFKIAAQYGNTCAIHYLPIPLQNPTILVVWRSL